MKNLKCFKDCTGNISAVPERNLLKIHILDNTVNLNHRLTLKHDLCIEYGHLKIMCTGNFSAAPERNLLKLEILLTVDNFTPLRTSMHNLCTVCAHLKLTCTGNVSTVTVAERK